MTKVTIITESGKGISIVGNIVTVPNALKVDVRQIKLKSQSKSKPKGK